MTMIPKQMATPWLSLSLKMKGKDEEAEQVLDEVLQPLLDDVHQVGTSRVIII